MSKKVTPLDTTSKIGETLKTLVKYATLAPSSHNTQCWKFANMAFQYDLIGRDAAQLSTLTITTCMLRLDVLSKTWLLLQQHTGWMQMWTC